MFFNQLRQLNNFLNVVIYTIEVSWSYHLFSWWILKEPLVLCFAQSDLGSFTTDSAGELDVFGHDGDTLSVDSAQVGVLKQTNKIGLACFLKGHHGRALETQIGLEVLSDLTDQTLEGQLADQQFGGFLVTPDLTKSHSTGPVTMRLLDSTSGWCTLASGLCGQLLTGSFSSG